MSSTTDIFFPKNSNHCFLYKLSGFIYLVDRMLKAPLTYEVYKHELSVIKYLATFNDYSMIAILVKRRLRKLFGVKKSHLCKKIKEEWWCIPYVEGLSDRLGLKVQRH